MRALLLEHVTAGRRGTKWRRECAALSALRRCERYPACYRCSARVTSHRIDTRGNIAEAILRRFSSNYANFTSGSAFAACTKVGALMLQVRHAFNPRGVKMNQSILAIGLGMAVVAAGSTDALAKKAKPCDVVGFWTASVEHGAYTIDIQMTTSHRGTSPDENPLCNDETSKIKTTTLSNTTWDFSASSKKCSEVETVTSTFASGSCTSASGTLTVPGAGSYPVTLTESTGGAKRSPSRTLLDGMK
jgi:hypothetical protein